MLAEELSVLDADAPLWHTVRPLLDAAFRLEQNAETYSWHGWNKQQIHTFLQRLPTHCTLLVGVWETVGAEHETLGAVLEREVLVTGFVCEVVAGEVHSIRTLEALKVASLPPIQELEPGFEHARELMRVAKEQVAPVAYALFTDKATWDEWLFAESEDGGVIDKGELLVSFAHEGRSVIMSQYPEVGSKEKADL